MEKKLTIKEFQNKYPIKYFASTLLKISLRNLYSLNTTDKEAEFLHDYTNLDRKDAHTIKFNYLKQSINDFFQDASERTKEDFKNLIEEKTNKDLIKSNEQLDIGDDFELEKTNINIKDEYPEEKYGSLYLKALTNDQFRFDFSMDDLKFLKDLNMIGDEDFELKNLQEQYLSAGIYNFFSETSTNVDRDVNNFFGRKDMIQQKVDEKEYLEAIKNEEKNYKFFDNDDIIIV